LRRRGARDDWTLTFFQFPMLVPCLYLIWRSPLARPDEDSDTMLFDRCLVRVRSCQVVLTIGRRSAPQTVSHPRLLQLGQHVRGRDKFDHRVEDLRPTVAGEDQQPSPAPVGLISAVLLQPRQPTTKLLPVWQMPRPPTTKLLLAWLAPYYQPSPPTTMLLPGWQMPRPRTGSPAKVLRRTRRRGK
jgi:hypothetical protein